jgi:hypothetical protein
LDIAGNDFKRQPLDRRPDRERSGCKIIGFSANQRRHCDRPGNPDGLGFKSFFFQESFLLSQGENDLTSAWSKSNPDLICRMGRGLKNKNREENKKRAIGRPLPDWLPRPA